MQTRRMGLLRNSSTIRGIRNMKTISDLFQSPEEREYLLSIVDQRELNKAESREKARFARQDEAKIKFEKNYYKAREKMAAMFNKNRHLTELRRELQYNRIINNITR
ncbi:MAG: hypothetical protein ABFD08_09725 [Syntrophomonas sp.]